MTRAIAIGGQGKAGAARVFLLALIVRLAFAWVTPAAPITDDAAEYDRLARGIVQGRGYVGLSGTPTSARPPLYSYFLAAMYRTFDDGPSAARAVQAVIDAVTCTLVYVLAFRTFGVAAALVAAVFAILSLSLLFATRHILTETLAAFFMVASVLALDVGLARWRPSGFLLAGMLIGGSTLTRGNTVALPAALLLPIWVAAERKWLPTLRAGALILAGFVAVLAPWTLRNYIVHGAFVPVATNTGQVIYSSYLPPEGKLFGFTTVDPTALNTGALSEVERSRVLTQAALRHVREHPDELPRLQLLKLLYLASPFDWELLGGDGIFNFMYALMVPFAGYGLWLSRSHGWRALLLATPLAYTVLQSLALYGSPRFRLPVEPLLMILAGSGLVVAWQRTDARRRPLFVAAATLALVMGIAAYTFSAEVKALSAQTLRVIGLW